ncbi:MAG: hypothetical protein E7533_00590 [Ruminococcaceae bacterium]|nr:hypothetical protein [Oscillospiraceae bacterium]
MKLVALFYQNPGGFLCSVILLIFSAYGFAFNKKAAFIFFAAFVVVFAVNTLFSLLTLKTTRKYVRKVNKTFAQNDIDTIDEFPLPNVICDMRGNIVWYNSTFEEQVLTDYKGQRFNMNLFFKNFRYDEYAAIKQTDSEFNGKKYSVFITKIKSKSNPMLSFYFFDDTYLKNTEIEYNLSRPFVMLILVDNIDQLSRQLTDSKFAMVSSGIESRIEEWLKHENLILKKTGNGTFLVIGERRNYDRLAEKRFSVLSDIRSYEYNNTPVYATLSIGVGSGEDFAVCESRAKKALDMSLGRGGDQVAVYTDDGYVYFGGMSNRANDNSRVSPRQTAANISNYIKKFKQVIIVGHKFSDYDAIGSAMGIQFYSEANGVPAYVVVDEKTTLSSPLVSFARERGFEEFISVDKALDMCDENTALFVVDTHRLLLLDAPDLYEKAGGHIVIDHHRRCDDYISDADIFYHLPSPSSTCEMVSELIQYSTIQEKVPDLIATALLSGIVLDTKDYVLRTSQRTFEAAAFLRENNADTVEVRKLFSYNSDMIVLKNEIISNGVIYKGFMISGTDSDNKNIRVITSKAADEMLNIEGVRGSFVIYFAGNGVVQISARSFGQENVQLIMEELGGGGHNTMAAAQLPGSDMVNAKTLLFKAIDDYLAKK